MDMLPYTQEWLALIHEQTILKNSIAEQNAYLQKFSRSLYGAEVTVELQNQKTESREFEPASIEMLEYIAGRKRIDRILKRPVIKNSASIRVTFAKGTLHTLFLDSTQSGVSLGIELHNPVREQNREIGYQVLLASHVISPESNPQATVTINDISEQ